MANYYFVTIESEKMTQEVANEIFQAIEPKHLIREFYFHEGYLYYNTRGLLDISDILNKYKFNDKVDKIEVKDEFDYVEMTEVEAVKDKIEKVINYINLFEEHKMTLSEEVKDIKNKLNNIIQEDK